MTFSEMRNDGLKKNFFFFFNGMEHLRGVDNVF